eukprot:TRINITY_DN276_c0_g1_i1.p1 TRINITY_DN276_c0_g1~~TRINITY_DN276_c0_g1_i1.p1  ORF type:complete len:266 (-),score=34.89 TRINITY_DN276_c0_g1_i1:713-1438(-)
MATDDIPGSYVKLHRVVEAEANAPQQDQQPGELVQAIPDAINPEFAHVQTCRECGQMLPDAFELPRNEPWMSGIFDCMKDRESCIQGALCPCVLFGKNVEALKDIPWVQTCWCHAIFVEGGIALAAATFLLPLISPSAVPPSLAVFVTEALLFSWWICGVHTGLFRQELQKKYHLANSPCDACCVHCVLHWCALCQEHREMKGRINMDDMVPMTVVNPPTRQEMVAEIPVNEKVDTTDDRK